MSDPTSQEPRRTKLKNRYLRQLSGVPFRLSSIETEMIGRPDFEYRNEPAMRDASNREKVFRVKNQIEPWYVQGNVEVWNDDARGFVDCPEFHAHDADGKGTYVIPKVKDEKVMRNNAGEVLVNSKVKWYHTAEIETEKPATVMLPRPKKDEQGNEVKDATGRLVFEDLAITDSRFLIELTAGGKGSQYAKMLAAIDGKLKEIRAGANTLRKQVADAGADEMNDDLRTALLKQADKMEAGIGTTGVVVVITHTPDAPKESIYTFEATDVRREAVAPARNPQTERLISQEEAVFGSPISEDEMNSTIF
jgi:hypothetical protein